MSVSSSTVEFCGGSITIEVDVDLFALTPGNRELLFEVLDQFIELGDTPPAPDPEPEPGPTPPAAVKRKRTGGKVARPVDCPKCGREFGSPQALGPHKKHCRAEASVVPIEGRTAPKVTLEQVAAAAKSSPSNTRMWEHVARELKISEAQARGLLIDARKAGLLPAFVESLGPIEKRPFDPDKVRAAQADLDR